MKIRALHFFLVILIAGLAGYYLGLHKITVDWKGFYPITHVVNKEPPQSLQKNIDFSQFWTVWEKIQNNYYDKKALDSEKLLNGAISGMVDSIGDPYTIFLPPVKNSDFKQGMAGQFEGIGAELGMRGKQIVVVEPLGGMPAAQAGIRAADVIVKVDNESINGWTLQKTVEKVRGPKGTKVTLTVVHKDEEKPVDIVVVRNTITVKSVEGWVKKVKDIDSVRVKDHANEEIAYIRLSQFGDNTNQDWVTLINNLSLKINGNKNFKGVILDLRNNPGGYLTDATFIASEFLKDAVVVIQEKGNGERTNYSVSRRGLLTDLPLVVLINKGSASASEIVAGALWDYKRAKLVGETSFGKGTIQQAEDLGNGAGLHITIAKWLTPKETWVHNKGITPDVSVKLDEKDQSHDAQLEKAIEEVVK